MKLYNNDNIAAPKVPFCEFRGITAPKSPLGDLGVIICQPIIKLALCFVFLLAIHLIHAEDINLAGKWSVRLDPEDKGLSAHWGGLLYQQTIFLPGTTDDAQLGIADTLSLGLGNEQLMHLTRKYSYLGPAWYSREIEIPIDWKGKDVELYLERVIWKTQVWIDGEKIDGCGESLVAPHRFNLTPFIKPGKKQILTICVDNRKQYEISVDERNLAHAYTNHTQVIWNGIIGKIFIHATDKVKIDEVQIYPDIDKKSINAKVLLINNNKQPAKAKLKLSVTSKDKNRSFPLLVKDVTVNPGINTLDVSYLLGDKAGLWDEFNPQLYTLTTELSSKNIQSINNSDFGLRKMAHKGAQLTINGRPLFLRGTLECCIFPLTGHPPMTHEGWRKVFETAHQWGLNHLRFHSWCPPEAAFEVADSMGFYLHVELPVWSVTIDNAPQPQKFMREEANRIIREYGNHPSFCFWSMGNELQKDFTVLGNIVGELKKKDNRHFYTTTSFTFEDGHGTQPEPNDDYFITQWTKKGWTRGQGVFNQDPPALDKDYRIAVDSIEIPLITHEVGQYSVYPDLKEIDKYTGVLKPTNFLSIRADLEKKGLLSKANDYTQASGKLAVILYKEEIERALKTPGISGFQLLDLHDFPGQGTALVGLLDAFWDSKEIITSQQFNEFCAPVVPLLRFEKATYFTDEKYKAVIEVSNYGGKVIKNQKINWSISDDNKVIASGNCYAPFLNNGYNNNTGIIDLPLNTISKASKLTIKVDLEGTPYHNSWNIWVYPANQIINYGKVKYTRQLDEALSLLDKGEKVLYNPDWKLLKGIEGKFVPVFWSPVHFPKQAGTMGILCNPKHKALSLFPTDNHTDWQWWDLNINSTTLIIDDLKGATSIVEMIDNFVNNRRLASLIEGKYGKGAFMMATFDLEQNLDQRPVAKQMLISLLNYMNSSDFSPVNYVDLRNVKEMISTEKKETKDDAKSIY